MIRENVPSRSSEKKSEKKEEPMAGALEDEEETMKRRRITSQISPPWSKCGPGEDLGLAWRAWPSASTPWRRSWRDSRGLLAAGLSVLAEVLGGDLGARDRSGLSPGDRGEVDK